MARIVLELLEALQWPIKGISALNPDPNSNYVPNGYCSRLCLSCYYSKIKMLFLKTKPQPVVLLSPSLSEAAEAAWRTSPLPSSWLLRPHLHRSSIIDDDSGPPMLLRRDPTSRKTPSNQSSRSPIPPRRCLQILSDWHRCQGRATGEALENPNGGLTSRSCHHSPSSSQSSPST